MRVLPRDKIKMLQKSLNFEVKKNKKNKINRKLQEKNN